MEKYNLTYDIHNGNIVDWLVLGPIMYPVETAWTPEETELSFRKQALLLASPERPLSGTPPAQMEKVSCGGVERYWKLIHCQGDHRVEASWSSKQWQHAQLWAYTCILSPVVAPCPVALVTGSACSVWLDDKKIFHSEVSNALGANVEGSYLLDLPLKKGKNNIWLLLEDVLIGPTVLSAKFQLNRDIPDPKVIIPIFSKDLEYWKRIEEIYGKVKLDRAVYTGTDPLVLRCQDELDWIPHVILRIRTPSGRIYGELSRELKAGDISLGVSANHLPSGDLEVTVMPPLNDYYDKQFSVSRSIPFQVVHDTFYDQEAVPIEVRLSNVLRSVAGRGDLLAEYARLKLSWSGQVDLNVLQTAVQRIRAGELGFLTDMLGLLVVASYLSSQHQPVPEAVETLLSGDLWSGLKKLVPDTEMEQLYNSACQILAGQLFPDIVITQSDQIGREVQRRGEQQALEWLKQHAWYGYRDWNPDLNALIPVCVALVDFAQNDEVREFAAVLLDKQIYLFALTSWKGCPLPIGSRVSASRLKSERLHAHSPIGMLLWGQGNNHEPSDGAAYLALSESYSVPYIIRSIAKDQGTVLWATQKDAPGGESTDAVTQVMYKTPEYMLASVQHPHYGKAGMWEHLWQAVLGAETVVFTNLPDSYSQSDFRPTGYWRGNARLPRLAQWQDSLVAIYDPQGPYPLDFTHAYFPVHAFDEYRIEQDWVFARKGDAYIALYASNGLGLVTEGEDAFRELRSYGEKSVWCCQMGRKSEDHSFDDFCQQVRAHSPEIDVSQVIWHTVGEQEIVCSWDQDLMVNGMVAQLLENKQVESLFGEAPLPAFTMDIRYQGNILRMNYQ